MAADPVDVFETYTLIGMREDLGPVIYNIDPTDTPVMNSIARATGHNIAQEWQTDSLDAAGFNAAEEASTATIVAVVPTVRPLNNMQISEKTVAVSGTTQAVQHAGVSNEMGYQLARLAKSLKRDCEFTISQNQARAIGSSGTARTLASYETWMQGDTDGTDDRGATGDETDFTAGTPDVGEDPDDGTQRALQEHMVQGVIQNCWNNGGDINLLVAGPFNKRVISGFAGNSTRFDIGEDQRLTAAISVYISDFGEHRIVASRFSRDRSLLVMDRKYWAMSFLRPFRETPLAKTGDAEQRLMNVEYTLLSYNNGASGIVADLTTSV